MGIGMPFCLLPGSTIPTGDSVIHYLKLLEAASLITVPSILEEVAFQPKQEGARLLLSSLHFVAFGGGQLKEAVGEKLSRAGVRLVNHYGTTESGPLAPIFVPQDDYDYRYFRLRKDIPLQIDPASDANDGTQRFVLTTFPPGWGAPFQIQDRLVQNPSQPGSDFNVMGRNDDVIVLATGEKVLPSILERRLLEDERLAAAVAFGDTQFEIGIIVQPAAHVVVHSPEDFRNSLWHLIQEANKEMDAQGRISSLDAIIVIPSQVRLPRSDKGSIMRREVYKMFESQINEMYSDLETRVEGSSTVNVLEMGDLETQIQEYIQTSLSWRIAPGKWSTEDDLFELGMDSLQALQLRRFLLSITAPPRKPGRLNKRIPRSFIYSNPSVSRIAKALRMENHGEDTHSASAEEINELIELFKPRDPSLQSTPRDSEAFVLLTGATGSLGAHLLAKLVSLSGVCRVVCLNRPQMETHPVLRQRDSLAEKGITLSGSEWSKTDILEADTSQPFLGLSEAWFTQIRSHVTHIIHAAWPMDFNRKVHSYKTAFQSLQNLISLALHASKTRLQARPRLLFVSSIATVGQYSRVSGESIVPEESMCHSGCANTIGYAQAKFVCERIVEHAAVVHSHEIDVGYVRVGQMSGSSDTGYWNAKEHIPVLIAASTTLGKLPKLDGVSVLLSLNLMS